MFHSLANIHIHVFKLLFTQIIRFVRISHMFSNFRKWTRVLIAWNIRTWNWRIWWVFWTLLFCFWECCFDHVHHTFFLKLFLNKPNLSKSDTIFRLNLELKRLVYWNWFKISIKTVLNFLFYWRRRLFSMETLKLSLIWVLFAQVKSWRDFFK